MYKYRKELGIADKITLLDIISYIFVILLSPVSLFLAIWIWIGFKLSNIVIWKK